MIFWNSYIITIPLTHGKAMHAIEQPSRLATLSSMDRGIIELAMMKQPMHMSIKKGG